ncbi:hypothetical protein I542_1699 [Mycobacteroides abscessus 1948]|uniref:Uncharacterized protein n=1 Tax=Mycobacteroides abscessus 1948 TaxID=1299323 RepID=A0A829QH06_9MYCO|nr:hypothetical protein I542_1699 [Mycobacteroides abscessus 1948]
MIAISFQNLCRLLQHIIEFAPNAARAETLIVNYLAQLVNG